MIAMGMIARAQEKWYGRRQSRYAADLSFREAARRFADRNELHRYMLHYFYNYCPQPIRNHRAYFEVNQRGFGESALHAMWWLLLREFRPRICLEIGVYRGQVISLWGVIAQLLDYSCEIHGISPFAPVGDTVSRYREDVDYQRDTLEAFEIHGLLAPTLIKALSTDRVAVEHIACRQWDLIYIDGCHDYEVVLADYRHSRESLRPGGLIVMDDSSLETSYRPPAFSFAGHPGPSQVLTEFGMKELEFLGGVGHNNVLLKPLNDDNRGSIR